MRGRESGAQIKKWAAIMIIVALFKMVDGQTVNQDIYKNIKMTDLGIKDIVYCKFDWSGYIFAAICGLQDAYDPAYF